MYGDFAPTSCVWAQELYLQQCRVSRSKTKFIRGDCETTDMNVHMTERLEVRTQISHEHERFGQESRPSLKFFCPLQSRVNYASWAFNALLYSASLEAEIRNCSCEGFLSFVFGSGFCCSSSFQPVTVQDSLQDSCVPRPEADCIFPFGC